MRYNAQERLRYEFDTSKSSSSFSCSNTFFFFMSARGAFTQLAPFLVVLLVEAVAELAVK